MSSIPANLPLRNDLIGEEPYGAPQLDEPVCLNVNENPYEQDPAVCATIAKRVREIAPTLNRYPDREHIELRQAFSDYLARESGTRLDVDELWGANGSNEIMLQLFQAFGGPGRPALGAHVDQMVGDLDDVEGVFDDDDRIAAVDERVQHLQQQTDVLEMKPCRGLVQNVERASRVALRQLRG